MRIRYVFSELFTGLRRNLSMTVAVVVTVWVSLVLVGAGLLIRSEVNLVKGYWYDKVEVAVFLCNNGAASPRCASGGIQPAQQEKVKTTLQTNPQVKKIYYESQQQAYQRYKQIYKDSDTVNLVRPQDLQASYRVQLSNPQDYQSVVSSVQDLPGVLSVQDSRKILDPLFKGLNWLKWLSLGLAIGLLIAAVLQIANTIRLTVFSRRREIGIMRLVGASTFYIQLPFIMESIVAAAVGAGLACGTVAFSPIITNRLRNGIQAVPWIGWDSTVATMPVLVGLGIVLAMVAAFATLRKYLRV